MKLRTWFVLLILSGALIKSAASGAVPCYELLLIDGNGHRVGYNPENGNIVEEIAGGTYTEESYLEDLTYKWLDVGNPPDGRYTLYIIGKGSGSYNVSINAYDKQANTTQLEIKGAILPGQIKSVFVDYTQEVGGITRVIEDIEPPVSNIHIGQPVNNAFGIPLVTRGTPITLGAIDGGGAGTASGVDVILFRVRSAGLQAGDFVEYVSSVPLSEGLNVVEYKSIDNAGNIEEIKTCRLFVSPVLDYSLLAMQDIKANGKLQINGNVWSNEGIDLRGRVNIDGNVYASTVTLTAQASVSGMIVNDIIAISSGSVDITSLAQFVSHENDNDKITVTHRGNRPINENGELKLTGRDSIALSSGTYYFKNIIISGQSVIAITGNAAIFCEGDISVSGGSRIGAEQPGVDFAVCTTGDGKIEISGESGVAALIYAPRSEVTVSGVSEIIGGVLGKIINITGASKITTAQITPGVATAGRAQEIESEFKSGETYVLPNPIKGTNTAVIHIETGIADHVEIYVYSIDAERVLSAKLPGASYSIVNNKYAYEYVWDVSDVPAGVYLCMTRAYKNGQILQTLDKVPVIK